MIRRILLITFLSVLLFCVGGYAGRLTYEPKYIIEIVPQIYPFVIEREVPKELRQFQSVEEFQGWFDNLTYNFEGDCDDWAYGFRDLAWADGYDVETEIIGTHMLCKTLIGNDIYFIDPQTHSYWLECYRD